MAQKKSRKQPNREGDNQAQAPRPARNPGNAFSKVGPTDVEGIEASDLPDARGTPETDPGKEGKRNDPRHTRTIGSGTDVGLRGTPDLADADRHGGRKGN